MSWTHGLRRVSELAWEALSTGRCAWESVGDVQLDRRGHVEHVWALGQRRPEENRKSKAACVMSSCGGGGFRSHKASYLSWRHARASKSGSARSRSMRRARARGRPRMMSHFVSHRHATRQRGGGGRPMGGALAPPFGRPRGPPERDRAGNGSAHPLRSTHPPTRVREWVSYEADPMIVLDGCTGGRVGSGVGAVPRVAGSGRWGLRVAARSAAAHSRDLFCCVNRVEVIPS